MKRENNFNILRLLAAFMVLVGHMSILLGISPMNIMGSVVHEVGVYIFFLIGGYLITKSYLSDPNPLRYAIKRIFRIMPALIVFVVFAVLIAGPLLTNVSLEEYFADPLTKAYFWWNIRLFPTFHLPGVFEANPSASVNGSLWTLPIEMAMYVLLPILLNVTGVRKNRKYSKGIWGILTVTVLAASIIRKNFFPQAVCVFYGTEWFTALNIIPYYLLGSMYAVCVPKEKLDIQKAVMLFCFCIPITGSVWVQNVLQAIVFPYLVFSIAFAAPAAFSKVMQKHEISYGIYLYGFFVQQLLIQMLAVKCQLDVPYLVYLVLSTLITVAFAYLSAILIEEPFQRLCKKILGMIKKKEIV